MKMLPRLIVLLLLTCLSESAQRADTPFHPVFNGLNLSGYLYIVNDIKNPVLVVEAGIYTESTKFAIVSDDLKWYFEFTDWQSITNTNISFPFLKNTITTTKPTTTTKLTTTTKPTTTKTTTTRKTTTTKPTTTKTATTTKPTTTKTTTTIKPTTTTKTTTTIQTTTTTTQTTTTTTRTKTNPYGNTFFYTSNKERNIIL